VKEKKSILQGSSLIKGRSWRKKNIENLKRKIRKD